MQEVLSFVAVLVTDTCVAGAVCVLYAFGIRMWARREGDGLGGTRTRSRIVSICCFAACVAIVLFALYLMIPFFH